MSNRNRASRRAEKPKPATAPQPPIDLDTVYRPELTGREIDQIGNLFDQAVRASGLQGAKMLMPLLDKITAPRREAMAKSAPVPQGK